MCILAERALLKKKGANYILLSLNHTGTSLRFQVQVIATTHNDTINNVPVYVVENQKPPLRSLPYFQIRIYILDLIQK